MRAMTSRLSATKTAHRALAVLAFGACVYFAFHGVRTALRPEGSDFTIYWEAGRAILSGTDPSAVRGYIYLPFFALCMAPFACLPQAAAIVVWQILSLAALVWIARASIALVRAEGLATPAWLAWAPLVCVLRLADSNFVNGQTNLLLFAAVVAGLLAWRRGRDTRAGVWIGFAAALKIVPAFFLVNLVIRRAWKVVASLAITALLCVFVVPAIAPGWSENLAQLGGWWRVQTSPYVEGGDALLERREYVPGQSLTATAYRLLAKTPATSRGSDGPTAELVDLDPATVQWIVRALQAAWLALIVGAIARSRRDARPGAWLREVSIGICGALTLAPLVHKAHMVWLILPFTLLLAGAPTDLATGARRARWISIGLGFALIALTTPTLLGRVAATSFLSFNTVFFGLQCLLAALCIDVFGARRAQRA
jgi:alpha-1,2-mannosyltransferase